MSEKKKILIFIDWFLPGYKAGGPIRSVANIVNSLSEYFEFYIITSDRDLGDEKSYENIELNKTIKKTNYSITYLTPDNQNYKTYKRFIKKIRPEKIYFNSLFSVKFALLPIFIAKKIIPSKSIILAPRGMLGQGALSLKSTKKSIFLKISKSFKLFFNITWHATTQDEADDIKSVFKTGNITIAENISAKPKNYFQKEKLSESRFVFISRISKKKNILFAIELFKKLKTENKIVFDIFGPVEDAVYMKLCEEEITKLPNNISIKFKGKLYHNEVEETLKKYHFFLFPTLHENYGHAIFEAISASCPVILSRNTPWQNLEEKNIGWDISLNDKNKFKEVIQKCIDMKQEEYDVISNNAFNFAKSFSENSQAVKGTKKMFEDE